MKRDNLKRHHDTHNQNNEFADEYPPGSHLGKENKMPSENKHLHDCLHTAASAYQQYLGWFLANIHDSLLVQWGLAWPNIDGNVDVFCVFP